MRTITLIAATGENNALGKDNRLLWHLPDDFKRFKSITSGNTIIMGRKTFESFPAPLPNRKHIIITRDKNYATKFENCYIVHSLKEALKLSEDEQNVYIIGGGEIYELALDKAHRIELTRVHDNFDADAFFPAIDTLKWRLVQEEHHPKDRKHKYDFTYLTYEQVKN